jgi:flagellar secretion chaperone FliS
MSAAYIAQYQNSQVNTASPERLLIMMYDGAIRFVGEASSHLEDGRVGERGIAISKAMAIISELSATLDHEIGGQIAANLAGLYDYMLRELLQANLHDDGERLTRVKGLLADLRLTWLEAIEKVHAEKAAPAATAEKNAAAYKPLSVAF